MSPTVDKIPDFKRTPDLEWYIDFKKSIDVQIDVPNDFVKEVVSSQFIYSSPSCNENEIIGSYLGDKIFNKINRIAYASWFFDKELSNINGTLSVLFPVSLFDSIGFISQDDIIKIVAGGGDFIFSEGYVVLSLNKERILHVKAFFTN